MSSNSGTRRFEYRDEKSSKFWEISVAGIGFTVCYGKIGTDGQSQPKEFADAATAEKQAQKLIAEKIGKGYQEVIADPKQSSTKPAAQPAEATTAEKPAKATKPAAVSMDKEASVKEATTDLVKAIKVGDADLVARILDRGFNPNTRFGFGREYGISPLHLAAESAYWGIPNHAFLKVVPMLFEATEKRGWIYGRLMGVGDQEKKLLTIISILLDKGADPLAINGEGRTPFEVKYVIGHSARSNNLFSRLHATLVPPSGSAQTVQGELLRLVGKLGHERLGNGWCNLIDSAYEIELEYLHNFFSGPDAGEVFSESEMKCSKLAASMAFLVAYEESGAEPTHSSLGKDLLQNKKAIRNGWKRACSERGGDQFSSEPFEAVEDFCIEYCRRQPPTSTLLTNIFEAKLSETPTSIHPELLGELSSHAANAWLAVMATVTEDLQVIDRLIKSEDAPGREALGCNPHLEARHIDALARDGVSALLAANPSVAASKLNIWAKYEDPEVRKAVAENPTTPLPTLIKLSDDTELDVQQAARNEIQRREVGRDEAESRKGPVFADDPQTLIRQALIKDDQDAIVQWLNVLESSDTLTDLLPLVCVMPVSVERRLMYANYLFEKGAAASGDFIVPLIEAFIVALGTKGAEREVASACDYLLKIISQGISLEAISAEAQCKLYEYRRKERHEASQVLFALIDYVMPIREKSFSRNSKTGRTIIEMAIDHADIELVSRVVNSERKSRDEASVGALSAAVGRKNQKIINLLLSDGVERYASVDAIKKAIDTVCYPNYGNPKGVEELRELISAYSNLVSDEAVTTLLFEHLCGAVENGYVDLVEELIRNGAPVDHRSGQVTWGNLLSSFFEMNPKDKILLALVDAGLDLSHPSADRYRENIQKFLKRAKR